MKNFVKEEDASGMECPVGRSISATVSGCKGSTCAVWRWRPGLASDQDFVAAVKREMECLAQDEASATGEKPKPMISFHKQAVANVSKNPEGYGLKRTEGYCGFGGLPT